jgi:predicted metal-dependent phosphoesterase TrpH
MDDDLFGCIRVAPMADGYPAAGLAVVALTDHDTTAGRADEPR